MAESVADYRREWMNAGKTEPMPFGYQFGRRLGWTEPLPAVPGDAPNIDYAGRPVPTASDYAAGPGYNDPNTVPDDWFRYSGVDTSLVTGTPDKYGIPDWARQMFTDPAVFYDWYQKNQSNPAMPAIMAEGSAAAELQAKLDAARVNALETLTGARERTQASLEGFQSDAGRNAILAEWARRADPNFNAISETETQAGINVIAQRAALNEEARLSRSGGQVASGVTGNLQASASAAAGAVGQQIRAKVVGLNEQQRTQALANFASFSNTTEALEQAYLGALNQIDAQIAAMENDVNYVPTDFIGYDMLGFAQEAYLSEVERADEALQAQIEASQFNLEDWVRLGLGSIGTGAYEGIAGAFGG